MKKIIVIALLLSSQQVHAMFRAPVRNIMAHRLPASINQCRQPSLLRPPKESTTMDMSRINTSHGLQLSRPFSLEELYVFTMSWIAGVGLIAINGGAACCVASVAISIFSFLARYSQELPPSYDEPDQTCDEQSQTPATNISHQQQIENKIAEFTQQAHQDRTSLLAAYLCIIITLSNEDMYFPKNSLNIEQYINLSLLKEVINEMMKHPDAFSRDIIQNLEEIIHSLINVTSKKGETFIINNHAGLVNILNYSPSFINIASKILNHFSWWAQKHGQLEFSSDFFDEESIFHRLNPQQQDEFFSTIQDSDASAFILTYMEEKLSQRSKDHLRTVFEQRTYNYNNSCPAYFE